MINDNPVLGAILARASVRRFQDRPVAREAVEALLRAAMAAPSAKNARPWEFMVVDDRDRLKQLADALPYGKMLAEAPLAITVAGDLDVAGEATPGLDYWVQDCSAATMNLLLAAHALGLGAVWLGVWPVPDRVENVGRILALPPTVAPLCVVAVGHPAQPAEAMDKYDPDKVHWRIPGRARI